MLDDEKPARDLTVAEGFWLGQTDVTQAAYQRVIGSNPSHFKGENLPVETVNWDEAQSYCRAIGGRLPTEAEWEYSARAGSSASRYGNLDDVAWYLSNSGGKTHEIAQKRPNAFGLYDMFGNVWQWTPDWYDAGHTTRVLRGGSWLDNPQGIRVSRRGRIGRGERNFGIGFRCVGE
jgi:formylglycine-generating enzyme required for sulfatase activity